MNDWHRAIVADDSAETNDRFQAAAFEPEMSLIQSVAKRLLLPILRPRRHARTDRHPVPAAALFAAVAWVGDGLPPARE